MKYKNIIKISIILRLKYKDQPNILKTNAENTNSVISNNTLGWVCLLLLIMIKKHCLNILQSRWDSPVDPNYFTSDI